MSFQNNRCRRDNDNRGNSFKCMRYHNEDECRHMNCHRDNCCKCHNEDECKHMNWHKCNCCNCHEEDEMQTHVHEYSESVKLAEEGDDRHNHRVAGVTGEAIPINGGTNHVHRIRNDNTDFLDHFHQIRVTTGPAIPIPGTNKHVHLVSGQTTVVDGHFHIFLFTTQIQAPLV
ncbi:MULTISPECIES: YmaF family protein [Romboutsia]|uniref:YmaF family n=1 Tax=Romboutsia hominis TaxID=1507512 RepID=A0A2P2BV89_9FIRM|nr:MULTISPECIES: YmaF family protein [Romboutsia]CEI74277.1 YmaF family [Romboutsia hominis]